MTKQLPIEKHYGLSTLIHNCWDHDGSADDWRRTCHTLQGAWMAADNTYRGDISMLQKIAFSRLEMASPDWRSF